MLLNYANVFIRAVRRLILLINVIAYTLIHCFINKMDGDRRLVIDQTSSLMRLWSVSTKLGRRTDHCNCSVTRSVATSVDVDVAIRHEWRHRNYPPGTTNWATYSRIWTRPPTMLPALVRSMIRVFTAISDRVANNVYHWSCLPATQFS